MKKANFGQLMCKFLFKCLNRFHYTLKFKILEFEGNFLMVKPLRGDCCLYKIHLIQNVSDYKLYHLLYYLIGDEFCSKSTQLFMYKLRTI